VENCGKRFGWKSKQEGVGPAAASRGKARAEYYPLALSMCSACAGDYEDPDRTAWTPDEGEDEERDDGAPRATDEEFPAEE
jgi:hypothetical protein